MSQAQLLKMLPMSMPIRLEGESEETIAENVEMVVSVVDEQAYENIQTIHTDTMEIENRVEELGDLMPTGFACVAGPHDEESPSSRARIACIEASEMKESVFRSEESFKITRRRLSSICWRASS